MLRILGRKKIVKKKRPRIHLVGFNCVQSVDESGRIVCLSPTEYAQKVASNAQLQALQILLAQLGNKRKTDENKEKRQENKEKEGRGTGG